MIATPSPGQVKSSYVHTLVDTIADLGRHGIETSYASALPSGDVPDQRNQFGSRLIATAGLTHLFFIDGDMSFDGALCRRMLWHDKPFIGAVYRSRNEADERWLVRFAGDTIDYRDGITRCIRLSLGCALIRREVFETMIAKGVPAQETRSGTYYNFFGARAEDAAHGRYVSEDFSFSDRWTKDCGGEVWAVLDAKIGHVGDYAFGARQSYLDYLKSDAALKPQDA